MPNSKTRWTILIVAFLFVIGAILLVLVSRSKKHKAGGQGMGHFQIEAVNLGNKRFFLTRDLTDKGLEGQLMDIRFEDQDSPGSLYRFELEDAIAESYPPQAVSRAYEKSEEEAGRITVNFDQAKMLTDWAEQAILIDVRTPEEFAAGHVPGAINMPLDRMESDMKTLGTAENRIPIVYCRSGARSEQASRALIKAGFKVVFDAGGIMTYSGPIEK